MGEDSLLERVTAAAQERQLFAQFTHRLPAHLAQNNRMIWLSFCQVGKVSL